MNKKAFTLAEVLITLGIIGVVAALTMPVLIANYKNKVFITKTKKVYSNIQNAIIMAQQDSGNIGDNEFLFNVSDGYLKVTENFAKYFNGATVCQSDERCKEVVHQIKYADSPVYDSSGNANEFKLGAPLIMLNDGSTLKVEELIPNCDYTRTETYYEENGQSQTAQNHVRYCALVYFDINGAKLPNQFGQDAFYMGIFKDKITPGNWSKAGGNTLKNILSGDEKLHVKRQ